MADFYVYIHRKPTGEIFYCGKGIWRRATAWSSRSEWHKNIIAKYGVKNITVQRFLCQSEEDAFRTEKMFIRMLRERGEPLVNLTDGGEGHSGFQYSQEARQKRSARLKQFYASDEGKRVNKELNNYRIGRKNTPETKKKMSEAAMGKKKSDKHSYNLSLARIGKPKTGSGTGVAGVNWVETQQSWRVSVTFRGVTKFHGYFKTLLDAVAYRFALQAKNNMV